MFISTIFVHSQRKYVYTMYIRTDVLLRDTERRQSRSPTAVRVCLRQHIDRPNEQSDEEGETDKPTDCVSDKRAVVVLASHLKTLSLVRSPFGFVE